MKNFNFKEVGKNIGRFASHHSPELLTGLGVTGMIATTILAVRTTPKALQLIEDRERETGETLTKFEVIGITWKCYLPCIVTGVVSTSCIIGASSVNARRNAALATAYTLSETALKGYREKVIETLGEEKDKEIRDSVSKDKLEKAHLNKGDVIITNKGNTLCLDAEFGRLFRSDVDKIKRIENELNRRMLTEMYISLNDFYYELGIPNS